MTLLTAPAVIHELKPAGPPPCRSSSRSVLIMTVVHNPFDSRIWFRQINALLSSGWKVTYAAPFSGYDQCPPVADERLPGSLTCLDIPRAAGRRRSRADRAARDVLKRLAPQHDLVLVHDPELLVSAAGLRLRNLVWDVHEDPGCGIARQGVDAEAAPSGPCGLVARRGASS
jgi:hypothetical protein